MPLGRLKWRLQAMDCRRWEANWEAMNHSWFSLAKESYVERPETAEEYRNIADAVN